MERAIRSHLRMDRGVKARHQKCRGRSLAGNIAKSDQHLVTRSGDKVVVVAADLITRERDSLEFVTIYLRRPRRLETLLDLGREFKFPFHSLATQTFVG